jgi:hypothetical protein
MDDTFFGVFNRKGELEAVESTKSAATASACNLSPGKDGKAPSTPIGRTVEPVTVIRGDLGAAIAHIMALASDAAVGRHLAKYQQALKDATTTNDKGQAVVVANNALFEAKERLRTAAALKDALTL